MAQGRETAMGAIATRARSLLRENVRATFLLAVVAGLAGGLVLATWSTARRGSSSFDRMLAATGQPDFIVSFCAKDSRRTESDSDAGCPTIDPVTEATAMREMPDVEAVSRAALVVGRFDLNGQSADAPVAMLLDQKGFATYSGRPTVIAGGSRIPRRRTSWSSRRKPPI